MTDYSRLNPSEPQQTTPQRPMARVFLLGMLAGFSLLAVLKVIFG